MATTERRVNNGACDVTLRSRWQNDKHRRWRPLLVVNLRASTSNYEYASISLYYECVCARACVCYTPLLLHTLSFRHPSSVSSASRCHPQRWWWRVVTSADQLFLSNSFHRRTPTDGATQPCRSRWPRRGIVPSQLMADCYGSGCCCCCCWNCESFRIVAKLQSAESCIFGDLMLERNSAQFCWAICKKIWKMH